MWRCCRNDYIISYNEGITASVKVVNIGAGIGSVFGLVGTTDG